MAGLAQRLAVKAHRKHHVPVTAGTRFQFVSMNKNFTALV